MYLHLLKPAKGSKHRKLRVGRGRASGKGKTAGRGHKGQFSRAGSSHKPLFEGGQMPLVRKLPTRGFKNYNRKIIIPINLSSLNIFDDDSKITTEMLIEKGLANGRFDGIKILGNGNIEKKLHISANAFSESAKKKIESIGGSCEVI
tara:strand:- start:2023 stop:2463 length:441 start_codon:yes stop_codon:yes gene_type:complete